MLTAKNEYDVSKMVCTTIRPTQMGYNGLYDHQVRPAHGTPEDDVACAESGSHGCCFVCVYCRTVQIVWRTISYTSHWNMLLAFRRAYPRQHRLDAHRNLVRPHLIPSA
eukprot:40574-Eustigmatos_ZCMA.PRE.1